MTELPDLLGAARRARLAGDYAAAELACRDFLDRHPIHAEASGLLGQCLAEQGNLKAAAEAISLALSLAPGSPDVRISAAALREREGDIDEAIAQARQATKLAPDRFEAFATLGNLLGKRGDFADAASALTRAIDLNPRHAGAALLLAGAALEIGDVEMVRRALDLADAAEPGLPQTLKLRAALARAAQDWPLLAKIGKEWLLRAPTDEEARIALAHGLGQLGFYETASEVYAPVADARPLRAAHVAAMGRYRLGARNMDDARARFESAIALDANCAEAHFGLGRLYTYTGRLAEAEAACRRALAADPRHAEAWGQLAEVTGGALREEEIAAVRALAADEVLDSGQRSQAAFALGEALHRSGQSGDAFAAWRQANDIKRRAADASPAAAYDARQQEGLIRRLKTRFPRDLDRARAPASGSGQPTPIFIVGMPRSGTTLVESALSAHPEVNGGGELPGFPQFLMEFLQWADRTNFSGGALPVELRNAWRRRYLSQVAEFGLVGRRFVTDKQPVNFLSLGLIRAVFPEAPIIHIRRNPVETGLSIYRRNFSHQWRFASDLDAIGHYYGQYADLMNYWGRAYRGAFAFVQYETLAEDFEAEVRRLIDYCDLGWDPGCLQFHEADRPVVTFSAAQVRKPVSTAHIGASSRYAAELRPLREALSRAGVDLDTGAKAQD